MPPPRCAWRAPDAGRRATSGCAAARSSNSTAAAIQAATATTPTARNNAASGVHSSTGKPAKTVTHNTVAAMRAARVPRHIGASRAWIGGAVETRVQPAPQPALPFRSRLRREAVERLRQRPRAHPRGQQRRHLAVDQQPRPLGGDPLDLLPGHVRAVDVARPRGRTGRPARRPAAAVRSPAPETGAATALRTRSPAASRRWARTSAARASDRIAAPGPARAAGRTRRTRTRR